MAGNPYDQFDAQGSENPYDKFEKNPYDKLETPAGWWATINAVPANIRGGLQQAVGGVIQSIPEQAAEFATFPARVLEEISGETRSPTQAAFSKAAQESSVAKAGAGIAESGKREIEEATPQNLSYWQKAALSGISSTAQQVPGLVASLATKSAGPALASAGVTQGGQSYAEHRAGGDEPGAAFGRTAIDVGAEVGFELIPLKFIMDKAGGPVLNLIKGTLVREVPTEVATTAVQKANDLAREAENKGKPWDWQEYGQALLDTIGATMVSAPLTAGAAKVTQAALNRRPGTTSGEVSPPPGQPGAGPAPIRGENPPLPPPTFDAPTNQPATPKEVDEIKALIDSIDADLLTDEDVKQAEQRQLQRQEAQQQVRDPQAEVAWLSLQAAPARQADIGELGTTAKQAANAVNYANPNIGDRLGWPIQFGPEGTVGKLVGQVHPGPGTYSIGKESADRPLEYLGPLHQTVEGWRQQNMPNATVILSNEQLPTNSALGAYRFLQPGMHMIVPAVIRSPKMGMKGFNVNTQASAFYNATHEFGHALGEERFWEGIDPALAQEVAKAAQLGPVDEALTSRLPAPQAAVISEYSNLRRLIQNNQMSAQQFVDTWIGPAKAGRKYLAELGVAPTDNAMAVAKAVVKRASEKWVDVNQPKASINEFLSLDEYLAEQYARHAYQTKMDLGTPLGQYFAGALSSLRKFFVGAKKDNIIAPGTAFRDWVQGLSAASKVTDEKALAAQSRKGAGKAPVATPVAAVKPKKSQAPPRKKVVKVQHNAETDTDAAAAVRASGLVDYLLQVKALPEAAATRLKDLINRREWDQFRDEFQPYMAKNVKLELDETMPEDFQQYFGTVANVLRAGIPEEAITPKILAEAAREWKEKQFKSGYFKAWFGDWENDSENASKVRRAAVALTYPDALPGSPQATEHGFAREAAGPPLVVYHATRAQLPPQRRTTYNASEAFDRFEKGDIGFHFGTLRAAHERVRYFGPAAPAINTWVIPATLNIRNPIWIPEDWGNWAAVTPLLNGLERLGIITAEESDGVRAQITGNPDNPYDDYPSYEQLAPLRDLLIAKGYDGIVYRNAVEDKGSISFIAFHPNQVKSILGSRTFSRSDNMHLELDHDAATPEGVNASKFLRAIRNFLPDQGPLRRALRRVKEFAYQTFELQQLAHVNPDVSGLVLMNEHNTQYTRHKSALQAPADQMVGDWKQQGKENDARVSKAFFTERDGGKLWFDVVKKGTGYEYAMSELARQELKKAGIDIDTPEGAALGKLVLDGKNTLMRQMDALEDSLITAVRNRVTGMDALKDAIIPIKRKMRELRNVPFFPQGRFGDRIVVIMRKKTSGPGYEPVYREHFENRDDWIRASERARANARPDEQVKTYENLTDKQQVLMALPLDFIDLAASELGLSDQKGPNGEPSEVEILTDLAQAIKVDKAFTKYDEARMGLKGYSTDALRSFANFTWHNANLIAKLKYRSEFNSDIRHVGSQLRAAQLAGDISQIERLGRIKKFMEGTRDYVMSPPNELQALRSLVSLAYLGFNVKTALLNTFGLMTTWSDLTTRHGQGLGNKIFWKAFLQGFASINLFKLNEPRGLDSMTPDVQQALDRAIKEGVLSQSYSYHLAGLANSNVLARMAPVRSAAVFWQRMIDVAMWTFRVTELATRRISFIAEFQAAQKAGMTNEEAYTEAVTRTNKLQNDYSAGNRVPFMRGSRGKFGAIGPLATVFASFAQHMAWHAYGGYELGERRAAVEAIKEAIRTGEDPKIPMPRTRDIFTGYTAKLWLAFLLLAGYEGLPGAENLIDLVQFAWRHLGGQKPIRQYLRELIQGLDGDPMLMARGLGHNVAGFDVSRSLGTGRIFPGTDSLAKSQEADIEKTIGTLALDVAGPTGGLIKFLLQTAASDKPLAQSMMRAPGGIGNIWTSYEWSQFGVRAPTGALITHDLKTGELRDLTMDEILGKALGFNPTIVSQEREIRSAQYDAKIYWQTNHKMLLDNLWTATWQKDREAQADARKKISEFNSRIPPEYKDLRINGAKIAQSLQAHRRAQRLDQQQKPGQKSMRGVYGDIRESFEEP